MKLPHVRSLALAVVVSLVVGTLPMFAAGLEQAEVTRAFNVVDILNQTGDARPAEVGDEVSGSTAVRTGGRSRAELTFNDQSIARLGGNTIFSFNKGTRDMNLDNGVILLQVPKGAGGAEIRTSAVTAAVTGTTVFVEFIAGNIMKFIVIEGLLKLTMTGELGESVLLKAGQMITVPATADRFPDPVFVDLKKLVETSGLMSNQFAPLGNQQEILGAIQAQRTSQREGQLIELNYGVQGEKNIPVLSVADTSNQLNRAQTTVEAGPNPGNRLPPQNNRPVVIPQQQQQQVTKLPGKTPETVVRPAPKPMKPKVKKKKPEPKPLPKPPPKKKLKSPGIPPSIGGTNT